MIAFAVWQYRYFPCAGKSSRAPLDSSLLFVVIHFPDRPSQKDTKIFSLHGNQAIRQSGNQEFLYLAYLVPH